MRACAALFLVVIALGSTRALAGTIEVTAADSTVRTAPFDVAPPVTHVHAGDRLTGEADAQEGWLRVALPDGRNGFMHAGDALLPPLSEPVTVPAPVTAPVPPPPPESALAMQPPIVTTAAAPTPSGRGARSALLGVMFELMPVGSIEGSHQGATTSDDTLVTVALAPFIDVVLSPVFELGASPQFVFKVKTSGEVGSATEYDLRARLTARDPVAANARMFARFSPGYSIVSLPSGALAAGTSSPAGLWFDFAVGSEITVGPGMLVVVDLGYQLGLQGTTLPDNTNLDYQTRFVHIGVGIAAGL